MVLPYWNNIGVGLVDLQLSVNGVIIVVFVKRGEKIVQQPWQVSIRIGTHDEVHLLVFLDNLLFESLGHTTQESYVELLIIFLLSLFDRSEDLNLLPDLRLGIFSDGTCVEENDVGFLHVLGLVHLLVLENLVDNF